MRLRKKHGGCSVAGVEWPEDGAVAEVPDELGAELLALAPDEYEHLLDDTPAEEEQPEHEQSEEELKQPNKAASAEDWKAFALAHGGFEQETGVSPHQASRKAIVDHYTGSSEE